MGAQWVLGEPRPQQDSNSTMNCDHFFVSQTRPWYNYTKPKCPWSPPLVTCAVSLLFLCLLYPFALLLFYLRCSRAFGFLDSRFLTLSVPIRHMNPVWEHSCKTMPYSGNGSGDKIHFQVHQHCCFHGSGRRATKCERGNSRKGSHGPKMSQPSVFNCFWMWWSCLTNAIDPRAPGKSARGCKAATQNVRPRSIPWTQRPSVHP